MNNGTDNDEERGIVRIRSGSRELLLEQQLRPKRCDWKYVRDEVW